MKYLREYNSHEEDIDEICWKYEISTRTSGKNYTINDDGSIDVNGGVCLSHKYLKKLPLKFRNVSGDFYCSYNNLISLEGCPVNVSGSFYCTYNGLTSLKGCPKTVGGYFSASYNNLISCKCPEIIGDDLNYTDNKIRDLYGMPKVRGDISIKGNPVHSIVRHFIMREDKYEWVELFNDLDIIQDDYNVILDRLKYFYEGTKLNIDVTNKMLEEIKKEGYKII